MIALTFDDGPWPVQTSAILKILQANNIRATFFEIGQQARHNPKLSRMLTDAGMLVENHSESHPLNLNRLPAAQVAYQIDKAETDITNASGQKPVYFRPPGGNTTASMYPVLTKLGMKWVQWDIDTNDWKEPPVGNIVNSVVKGARPGAVVLMHDGGGNRSHTIAALPTIIQKLKAQGYVFVTLDSLGRLPHTMG
jgi:chitin deacetylase